MKVTKRPLDTAFIDRPLNHNVEWFTISNSMSEAYSSCRERVVWQYVHHIQKKFGDSNFLKRNCVVFVVRQRFMSIKDYTIRDTIQYFLRSEAKQAVEDEGINWYEWEEKCKEKDMDPIRIGLQFAWQFPTPDQKWKYYTWDEFILQCIGFSNLFIEYINQQNLIPLDIANLGPIVQKTLTAPLEVDGEILDETNGLPTKMKAQVNLVTDDGQLFIWKISNKRSAKRDKIADISETVDNQCAVVAYNFWDHISFPIKVTVCKAIVKKNGEMVELEVHKREITKIELDMQRAKLAIKAVDIKMMNLFKERSWNCPMCDFYKVCILGDPKDFVVRTYDEVDKPLIDDDDDDGMPF